MVTNIIALDFDGVICDSAAECLVSAYDVFARAKGQTFRPEVGSVPDNFRDGFFQNRPFTRDGKDYMLLLHFVDDGVDIRSQSDFDAATKSRLDEICRAYGVGTGEELEDLFQEARKVIRARDVDAWMEMNPLYTGMAGALQACRDRFESVYVTTSKPTEPAERILRYHKVPLPEEQILGKDKVTGSRAKNGHLERVCAITSVPLQRIHFVDDQVSHLREALGLGVQGYLATWGYNTAEQETEARGLGLTLLADDEVPDWMESLTRQ